MKKSNPLQEYYDKQCGQIRRLIMEECKTAEQCTAVCTMALERCNVQFSVLERHFPALSGLSMYRKILEDMEGFACGDILITVEMQREYENWCVQIQEVLEHQNIRNQGASSHWQLPLLTGMIEKLGTFFASGTPPYWDDAEISLIGVWLLFVYETGRKCQNPRNFNFYEFIRSRHPDIDAIGKERDALRIKLSKSVTYRTAYNAISDIYKNECKKYWEEAATEKKRLVENEQPMTVEKLVLTSMELERIRRDIQYVTTENPAKEDIRQRLHDYRAFDITNGETEHYPVCSS
ncbi:hypothetical protein AALC17_05865 [Oscillospiraceae bacterium 38-13]